MRPRRAKNKAEPTIALINIVFLMLVFFMVAGTLAPPIDPELELVNTRDLDGREPAYAIVVSPEGELRYRGVPAADVTEYMAALEDQTVARVMPDRNAPATRVLEVSRELRAAGADTVLIVTQKALE
ncbi:MAG: biopolymer transporter ExbD [Pseudomonadota bacterium]